MEKYLVQDVFGISRELPLNYVEREDVDIRFIESLASQKHIVIYGSSKQGKTCLRKHGLNNSDVIIIHCSNKMESSILNLAILKASGFELTESQSKTITGKNKFIASISAKLPWISSKIGDEVEKQNSTQTNTKKLEIDPDDVNDIISALNSIDFNKYIVLEDFHYLKEDAQKDFSVELKAFHEESPYCFIIVGVWTDENRLVVYNGDLTGRVIAINADHWTREQLLQVINKGEGLLNIEIDENFKEELIKNCYENVYIVQEACLEVCKKSGIFSTLESKRVIGQDLNAKNTVKAIVLQQQGRYNSFLTHFITGFQGTKHEMYKWILFPFLITPINRIEKGFKLSEIRKILSVYHPQRDKLNPGNVTQALQYVSSLQVKKEIKPIIIDYDQTDLKLSIVDKGFIVWLENVDRNELLEANGFPVPPFSA